MLSGGLFTRDFLIEGVRGTVAWQRLDDASLVSLQDRLKTLFASFGNIKNPNESETEKELIWPLLEAIGWADMSVQQNLSVKRRDDVPDALLRAIADGDDDGLEILFLLEHLAPVFVAFGVGIFFEAFSRVLVIDVTHRDEILALAAFDVLRAAAARADDADVDLVDPRSNAISGLILRESTRPVIAGLVAGILIAAGLSSVLRQVVYGLSAAFLLCGASFFLAMIMATQLPETKGKQLE